jgi:uncharacterized protein YbbC (DUF1343 family)
MRAKVQQFLKITIICFILAGCNAQNVSKTTPKEVFQNAQIGLGAEHFEKYVSLLKNKRVGMIVNQTSVVGKINTHIVDTLLKQGVKITKIFAPEHGFRGEADAGEHVDNTKDAKTGIPILSIYGKTRKPTPDMLKDLDVLVFDIQDVGARFYTYIGTLEYVMEAGAENNIPVMVLDRPNPNGHYVDGPILDKSMTSFVGMQAIPIVHGMTVGEYATMLNTEGLLANRIKCQLTVIECSKYDHTSFYELPVKPSPNLPNIRAIYLYPSICFFEGTNISLGRGTDKQFQVYGSPFYPKEKSEFEFTPRPFDGAKQPPLEGRLCYGFDLTYLKPQSLQTEKQINLKFVLNMYKDFTNKDSFFLKTNFIDRLAGTTAFQKQIKEGKTEAEIRATWQAGLVAFKKIRKKYLLYKDFE